MTLCPFTRGQVGWRDSDDPPDGVYDPIDHPASGATMRIGVEEAIGPGDWVDIYSGADGMKRLVATDWSMDLGQMLWDGMKYNGTAAPPGTYAWFIRGGARHIGTLSADTQGPAITNPIVLEGPGPLNTLQFEFADPDTRSGRVRAIATMPGVPDTRVIGDKFYLHTDGAVPPVSVPFSVPHEGQYTIHLRVWDAGDGQSATETVTFWAGDPARTEDRSPSARTPSLSLARPNPSGGSVSWSLLRGSRGTVDLRIIAVDGRAVRRWLSQDLPAGATRVLWDGRDDRGVRVPAGRYTLVARDREGNEGSAGTTLLR